jgi:hypothetical protein
MKNSHPAITTFDQLRRRNLFLDASFDERV